MKKKLAIVVILIAIGSLVYFVLNNSKDNGVLTIFGNIEIRQVDLSFQVPGKIEKMFFEEGDDVQKGDLVALLDAKDYKANYEKAGAEVDRASALNKNAQEVYERKNPLCTDSTISKQECDSIFNTKNETKANVDAAVASKSFAKNQLDYTKLYAPDDGIVMVRVQEPGATVQKAQAVYTLAKNKPIWIRTYVSEKDLGNIKYNMKAKVLTDSVDPNTRKKREYQGRIGYISPVAEFTPKTVQTEDLRTDLVYRIRVYVDEPDSFLRQGMPTTIKIDLKE